MNRFPWALVAAVAAVGLASSPVVAAPERVSDRPVDLSAGSGGSFSYTIVPTTPSVQYTPTLFQNGPYFNFSLTNTGTQVDTYRMICSNLTNTNFFGQVCIEAVCFPDSAFVTLNPSQSKIVGVNLTPFDNGECTADFDVNSVGDPQQTAFYQVTLFAGQGLAVSEVASTGETRLGQNAPNPMRTGSRIEFSLPQPAEVRLDVFDVAGRLVRTLAEGAFTAGPHAVEWNGTSSSGRRLAGGVYLYRLSTPQGVEAKRLTLVD